MNDDFSPFGDAFQFFRNPKPLHPCSRCGRPMTALPASTFASKVCENCLLSEMMDKMAADVSGAGYTRASTTASTGTTSKPSFEEVLRASAKLKQAQFERDQAAREQARRQQQAPPPPPQPAVSIDTDAEMLRRLIQLCHPDKHANSEASQKATRWLLDLKAKGK